MPGLSGAQHPNLTVPLGWLLPTWIVTVFISRFPTRLAILRGMKHLPMCLPEFFRASHLSLNIWSV